MNQQREDQRAVREALYAAETTLNAMGRVKMGSPEWKGLLMNTRQAIAEADAALRRMNRKDKNTCHFQGCYNEAEVNHVLRTQSERVITIVRFCAVHSATSKLPQEEPHDND